MGAVTIEAFLLEMRESDRPALFCALLRRELELRKARGDAPAQAEYRVRFPNSAFLIAQVFAEIGLNGQLDSPASHPESHSQFSTLEIDSRFEREGRPPFRPERVVAEQSPPPDPPQKIGRYRVERWLGSGGFGVVYLGCDEQLERLVAVKVPHAKLVAKAGDADLYLSEARALAKLDHPNIVPVYDAGATEETPCYVVSKYIEGTDLTTKLKAGRLPYHEAAEIVATIAEALHSAHKQGFVHRDVKPGNILLSSHGQPFLADFGLALREQDLGKGARYVGTPAYMSPEQARGEGHRVDGRSDIFSLGIVLYELLVGARPFRGETRAELRETITSFEPRPPRQYDENIPKELERICLKALEKRASDRHTTALDLAEDLRQWLGSKPPTETEMGKVRTQPPSLAEGLAHESTSAKVIPRGLRSFGKEDADFFLQLLPGPRNRDGLPESIHFWKSKIEQTDADETFSVGMIYGPSGCGKSSLVKAGLIPHLSAEILVLYLEATPAQTEARLLAAIRKHCKDLPASISLAEALERLRRGEHVGRVEKVLLIFDQFEQWLHASNQRGQTELVDALRQCDGANLQALLMVRDDFWLAACRLMRDLEIRILDGHNFAMVDLFSLQHARKVLAEFGRAYGCLPEQADEQTAEQKQFVEKAVEGLADGDKVIPVRLSLFVEMVKDKTWTPKLLTEVGGAEGVGVKFLEDTFGSRTAPPEHRLHYKAARAVLSTLLPDRGAELKGYMRSERELQEASGYVGRRRDYEELINILDAELSLISPADPSAMLEEDKAARTDRQSAEGQGGPDDTCSADQGKHYQLTHDYMVPAIRRWLDSKQGILTRAIAWCTHPSQIYPIGVTTMILAGIFLFLHTFAIWRYASHFSLLAFWIVFADIPYLICGVGIARGKIAATCCALFIDLTVLVLAVLFIAEPAIYENLMRTNETPEAVEARWTVFFPIFFMVALMHINALHAIRHARLRPTISERRRVFYNPT